MQARVPAVAALVLTAAFLAAYLPDAGHGFVKDDFAWIAHARLGDEGAFGRVLFSAISFYRPVVSLSFSVNEWFAGLAAWGYGLTNLALALACAGALFALARAVGLAPGASLAAAALWAFNFHGINMAVLWISGRTALCLTLFAVLAARAAVGRRPLAVFAWSLLAAGSKEEAVLLPLVCGVMATTALDRPRALVAQAWPAVWPSAAAVTIYLALRAQSGAFTPASAPSYYQLGFSPSLLAANVLQYADRSATLAAAAVLAMIMVVRRRPVLDAAARRLILQGAIWVVLALAITVWLPVRSSLYAVWPAVGAALAAAAIMAALWPLAGAGPRRALVAAALVLPFLLWPVYRSRNVRWVELADLTADTLGAVAAAAPALPPGSLVILRDDRSTRANLNNAFGTLYPQAAALAFGSRLELWIDPPPDEIQAAGVARPERVAGAVLALRQGHMQPVGVR